MNTADHQDTAGATSAPLARRENPKILFATMGLSALASLIAALVLSIDAWLLAKNPNAIFSCDLSTIVSCGKVAASWQAEVFGFPNAFIGLFCEPVVVTIAVLGMAGTKFPRWFMAAAQFVYLVGLTFAYWLFYESYTDIGAFCPWCLVITVGTTLVFFTMLRYNLRHNNLYLSEGLHKRGISFIHWGGDVILPVLMIATIAVLILVKYGPFLFA